MTILHVILFTLLTLREMSSGERGFNTFRICAAKICVKIPLKMSLGRVLLTKGPPYLCHLKHITYVLSVYLYYPHIYSRFISMIQYSGNFFFFTILSIWNITLCFKLYFVPVLFTVCDNVDPYSRE